MPNAVAQPINPSIRITGLVAAVKRTAPVGAYRGRACYSVANF